LAIETSCDETAAAVIDERLQVLSNVVSSQSALHRRFGGVVPEVASRAHVELIVPVIDQALTQAETTPAQLSAIAVVNQPGLVGSLLVGLTAAKSLALAWGLPLIPVDHIAAHLYACRMQAGQDVFPAVGLVVSGGHCHRRCGWGGVRQGRQHAGTSLPGRALDSKGGGCGQSAGVRISAELRERPPATRIQLQRAEDRRAV
jgi:hypothetical protein